MLINNQTDEHGATADIKFKDLIAKSNQIANILRGHCLVTRGDRVALLMSQSPEAAAVHAAVYKAGCVAVPLFVLFGPEALKYRLEDSGATTVFVEPSKLDEIVELQKDLPNLKHIIVTPPLSAFPGGKTVHNDTNNNAVGNNSIVSLSHLLRTASNRFESVKTLADDPALIIYTSGTTGPPKGALHAHRVLLGHMPGVEFPQNLFPQPNDLFWTPADWAWIGGLIDCLLPSLHHGKPVLAHRFKKFDPEEAFHILAKYKVRNTFMPPTALKMMREVKDPHLRHNYALRSIGTGGETLGEAVFEWSKKTFGLHVNEFYGQTECNLVLGNCADVFPVRVGSMGRPIPGHQVEVVDDNGKVLPVGSVGNVGVKAPHPVMFLEYWKKPAATKEKFAGGFLLTGDLAKKDEDGYFWYIGRSDDVIKSAGYRIGPSEIEDCLLKHPAISNAAAVGVPDELRNEVVKAFIVLQPDFKKSHGISTTADSASKTALYTELAAYVKTKLAKHEYPREFEVVESLPMTTTGKVMRKDLRLMEKQKYEAKKRAGTI